MIPNEVFHYTTIKTALEKILSDKEIKLSQLGNTNDPRETKERNFGFMYHTLSRSKMGRKETIEIQNQANKIALREWKVFCVSIHNQEYQPDVSDAANLFFRGDCRPRMWAAYAETHRGICLKFNAKKLDARLRERFGENNVFSGPIWYNDVDATTSFNIDLQNVERLSLKETIRGDFKKNWRQLFLTKTKDWESESEFRWLVHNLEDSPVFISIDGVVDGVLAGCDFPKAYYPSLKKLCRKLNIPAGGIEWENGYPYVSYESILKL